MEIAGTVRAVGSGTHKLKAGDYVCCLYPHHFDTAIVVNESDCKILSASEPIGDLLGQIHPLITSLHVARLLRLSQGDQVLVDCQQLHLAHSFAQIALLRASGAYVTFYSDAGLGMLQHLGSKVKLVDRQTALRQAVSNNLFDAVLTDAKDGFQLLSNVVKPGGRIVALGSSVPAEMISSAGNFLKKGVTIGTFDPIDGLAAAATQQSRATSNFPELAPLHDSLTEAVDLLRRGVITPMPCVRLDLARLPEAISKISQDDFVGSVILTRTLDTRVPIYTAVTPLTFNPEASYFLVGCLGGLGRSLT